MAVTLQNSGVPFSHEDASNSALTNSVPVIVASGIGTKMMILIGGEGNGTGGDVSVSQISVNGNTSLATFAGRTWGAGWSWCEIWEVESPPVGTYNVVATLTLGDATQIYVWVADGCENSGGFRSMYSDNGNDNNTQVIMFDTVVGDLIIDVLGIDSVGHGASAGGGGYEHAEDVASFCTVCTQAYPATGVGDNPGWIWSGAADFSYLATAFKAAGAVTQKLRPDADIATTGWNTAPLHSKIEEETADGTVITGVAS